MASNALRDVELQTDLWECRIKPWDAQLDMDVEARTREYRAANKQLTQLLAKLDRTQASMVAGKDVKRKIAKCIIKAMETVNGRMNKAMEIKLKKLNS